MPITESTRRSLEAIISVATLCLKEQGNFIGKPQMGGGQNVSCDFGEGGDTRATGTICPFGVFSLFYSIFRFKIAIFPLKRSVFGARKGHIRARQGQMVNSGFQDPKTT